MCPFGPRNVGGTVCNWSMKTDEEYRAGAEPNHDPWPDAPPDERPPIDSLPPYQRRQMLFGLFLDYAEQADVQLGMAAASRARRIDELRLVAMSIAREESEEDAARPAAVRSGGGHESGWSIENRAKTELVTEVAAAYTLSKNAAAHLVVESETLVHDLPLTLAALGEGRMRYEHAKVIATTAWSMPAESRSAFEEELVPLAARLIISAFRARAQAARERLHTQSMAERHEEAAAFRGVTAELGPDGMGYLTIHDTNEAVAAIYNRVTDMALPKSKDDPRTLAQRRADVATALLIDGDLCAATGQTDDTKPLGHGIVAHVHIEVPVLTLLGSDDRPATLEGKVPIDPASARRLVADAPGFFRLLTDPITGSIVAFDDKFRFLPPSLRRAVRLVDGTCTSPWCDKVSNETDGHHPNEWQESHDTSLANSALACPTDHRLIHNTRWTMRKLANGDKQWVSPCGRRYTVPASRRLSPAFVEVPLDKAPTVVARDAEGWPLIDPPEAGAMPF